MTVTESRQGWERLGNTDPDFCLFSPSTSCWSLSLANPTISQRAGEPRSAVYRGQSLQEQSRTEEGGKRILGYEEQTDGNQQRPPYTSVSTWHIVLPQGNDQFVAYCLNYLSIYGKVIQNCLSDLIKNYESATVLWSEFLCPAKIHMLELNAQCSGAVGWSIWEAIGS